mmetsp:Transcript_4674/g.13077  ORF Transcript_4674/g.13077 Transcript_4674/m.13077 type:complete len:350 (-) Transcript_4674:825-1874(-)
MAHGWKLRSKSSGASYLLERPSNTPEENPKAPEAAAPGCMLWASHALASRATAAPTAPWAWASRSRALVLVGLFPSNTTSWVWSSEAHVPFAPRAAATPAHRSARPSLKPYEGSRQSMASSHSAPSPPRSSAACSSRSAAAPTASPSRAPTMRSTPPPTARSSASLTPTGPPTAYTGKAASELLLEARASLPSISSSPAEIMRPAVGPRPASRASKSMSSRDPSPSFSSWRYVRAMPRSEAAASAPARASCQKAAWSAPAVTTVMEKADRSTASQPSAGPPARGAPLATGAGSPWNHTPAASHTLTSMVLSVTNPGPVRMARSMPPAAPGRPRRRCPVPTRFTRYATGR